MADLRIVDAPVLLQESITDDIKMPTGGLGNYAIRLGDLVWYVVTKEQLASKSYVDNSSKGVQDKLDTHISNKNNPHQVTKVQVGLGNVDNTADIDKPVSNATKSAITTATNDMATKAYVNQKDNLKADKATTLSGYGIVDAYTKDEINSSISLKADTSYVDSKSGDLTSLTTTDKSSLVKAINEVVDKTALFYNTVADMVADTKLKAGKAVITHGYYAPNDGGGARYLIKDTATDYSIPVANNLHAVFADSFDIRKFGIRDNATLDQTTEIQRMVNYADSRIYEIDFLGYHIMSPKTVCRYYTGTRTGKGMGFSYVHKIKNLTISNDKTKTLMHGDTCIFFLPKENGFGNFVLDNVTFDPFVADYKILAGDGDGHMHGFSAEWHEDMQIGWPQNQQIQTGYIIIYNNINFISPAVCYNLATNLRCNEIRITNAKGEYWGIYLWHWCDRLYAENVHGVWRDDLHANANPKRVLVTNLFQEEQEVGGGGFAYTQEIQIFNNISCIKKTDGSYYSTIVRQGKGKPYLKEFIADNVKGNIVWYMGNPEQIDSRYSIGNLVIDNFTDGSIQLMCAVDKVAIKNTIVNKELVFLYKYLFNDIYIENSKFYADIGMISDCTVNKFKAVNCLFGNTEHGMVYGDALIKDIHLINPTIYVPTNGVFMHASFNNLLIQGGILKTIDKAYFYKLIINNGININSVSKVIIDSFICYVLGGDGNYLLAANNGISIDAEVVNSKFLSIPNFILGSSGSLVYRNNLPEVKATLAYDPPSLATSTQQLTTVTLTGAKVGDIVAVSFNQPLQGTRMWAEVTAAATVTVYHRNETGATVDLASGTLTVKIV